MAGSSSEGLKTALQVCYGLDLMWVTGPGFQNIKP